MIPVSNSTNIEEYSEYDEKNNSFSVTYKGGRTYSYHDVDKTTYDNMVKSSSVGQFIWYHIRDKFAFTKVSNNE